MFQNDTRNSNVSSRAILLNTKQITGITDPDARTTQFSEGTEQKYQLSLDGTRVHEEADEARAETPKSTTHQVLTSEA